MATMAQSLIRIFADHGHAIIAAIGATAAIAGEVGCIEGCFMFSFMRRME
jgi:hypothetical protein